MQEGIRIYDRCNELALLSEDCGALTRIYLSEQHQQANQLVGTWMREAGMHVWQDAVGNICGRYEGGEPDAPALLLGSHLDTVRNAGKYDGMLGVITAIELVSRFHQQNKRFPFAIEVVGFGDEEGVRFGVTLLGSRGLAGSWGDDWLEKQDRDGISLAQALRRFGLDPDLISQAKRKSSELIGYLELHIEQGPLLESNDLALGVVTAINGAKSPEIWLILSFVLLAIFLWIEKRSPIPLMPLVLFKSKIRSGAYLARTFYMCAMLAFGFIFRNICKVFLPLHRFLREWLFFL